MIRFRPGERVQDVRPAPWPTGRAGTVVKYNYHAWPGGNHTVTYRIQWDGGEVEYSVRASHIKRAA